jgi:3-phenylpropionate/trans-cinnamate dioxygenase ferredoxin reductase subunit
LIGVQLLRILRKSVRKRREKNQNSSVFAEIDSSIFSDLNPNAANQFTATYVSIAAGKESCMNDYQYLIIGGGMTADAAAQGIRKVDASGAIGMISNENHLPYNRPPLSKGLWKNTPLENIWRDTQKHNVEIHAARTAIGLDVKKKIVVDQQGVSYSYKKLLLATGGIVRRLPRNADGVVYFRTLDDYLRLRELSENGRSFAVVGGGFIGSEIAAALAMNGKRVNLIFPEDGVGARVYPRTLSQFLNSYFREKGVDVVAKESVKEITRKQPGYVVKTNGGREFKVDGVVAGLGIEPDVELARSAGLKVDNGIHVNEFLQTSSPDVYAAGDAANFVSPALGKRVRIEHEDNALTMGEIAGKNMAGNKIAYDHLPFFYSDLFDLGYEAVGELDSRAEIVEDWKQEFREGVVYYLSAGRIQGVLLWNVWGQVDAARALIKSKRIWKLQDLKGQLPKAA